MKAKIQKWGNSLGIRIPMPILKDLALEDGSLVEIEENGERIIIRPSKRVSLMALLNKISEKNLHSETDWSTPEGEEIW